jgi:hypothetical protein
MLESPQPDAAHVAARPRRVRKRSAPRPGRVRRLTATSPKALFSIRHLDGRSLAFRRARAIAAELAHGFGAEITKVQQQAVERAALLCAIAEDLAARRLAGQPVPMDELLRAEGVARRAVRAILAERPVKPAGLQRARARWDEQARAAKAAKAARRRKAPAQTTTKALDDDQADD